MGGDEAGRNTVRAGLDLAVVPAQTIELELQAGSWLCCPSKAF